MFLTGYRILSKLRPVIQDVIEMSYDACCDRVISQGDRMSFWKNGEHDISVTKVTVRLLSYRYNLHHESR